jgi:AraC-like DNA-binding protein
VYEFTAEFMKEIAAQYSKEAGWFLTNNDIHSILLQSNGETEYLHHHIIELITGKEADSLQIDELVFLLLEKVTGILGNIKELPSISANMKKYHLTTIELAKEYLFAHFKENVSLEQLATHCHVSPFHFSRIFKAVLQTSPHQYLGEIRLNHAKVLLNTTPKSITGIAFECGFNSIEHFATAYRQKYKTSPSDHRRQLV